MEPEYAVEIEKLTVAYDNTPALSRVDLRIPKGKMVSVLGPNGGGKSTLLKAITGALRPVTGQVLCLGRPYREVRKRIAYVPQTSSVDWDFPVNVRDVVAMGCLGRKGLFQRKGKEEEASIALAMEELGLFSLAKRQIGELSGGQRQKVFLARALVQKAEIYLMDEPFAGIDLASEKMIVGLLKKLQRQGKTLILVHHDLYTVRSYFDYAVLLNGTVVKSGPVEEVLVLDGLRATYGEQFSFLDGGGEI